MNPAAIVVARLDSRRLPGKVLANVAGRPLLWYVVTRCQQVEAFASRLAIATTDRAVDDPLAEYCAAQGLPVFRGSADDVAGRVLACAESFGWDWFARVNADSPFVDAELLREACRVAEIGDYDLITNLQPRSFPYGVSVELIRTETYRHASGRLRSPGDREHVTQYLYEHLAEYRYFNLHRRGANLSGERLTVDSPDELATFRRFIADMKGDWRDVAYVHALQFITQQRSVAA